MTIPHFNFIKLTVFFFAFFTALSCSKDSDLLAEYVAVDSQQSSIIVRNLAVNDSYLTAGEEVVVMDVLSNDTFSQPENVQIVETSDPTNGIVTINEDNTLTYVPEVQEVTEESPTTEQTSESTDSFTYTTETTEENGSTTTQQATVSVTSGFGELKAFPGAEGFGKNTTGGRGGYVIEVTNLNDSGSGSFREALEKKGKRTIVFKVGGTINAQDYFTVAVGSGDVTIAGQTAPGDGILIKGGELRIQTSNVIVRYIRFRLGPNTSGSSNLDAIKIRSYESAPLKNVIIDHCSVSWGSDENISISNAENVTVQNSIIAECNKSFLIQQSKKISVLNNLMALNNSRNIRANTVQHKDLTFEQVNNIIYGFKWGTGPTDGMSFNIIGNNYRLSNNVTGTTNHCVTLTPPDPENAAYEKIENTHAFFEGNIHDSKLSLYRSELNPYIKSSPKNSSSYIATDASNNKLDYKLLPSIGANIPVRDDVDKRLIESYKNSSGSTTDKGTYPNISGGTSYTDNDKDGLADDWESDYGLDPNNAQDGKEDKNNDGYTNLEDFLYYLTQN